MIHVTTRSLAVATDGGVMNAYFARADQGGPFPGIVLLQEIFGVNDGMRDVARSFAEAGYAVMVPDLFWRQRPGIELGYSDEERKEAFACWHAFDEAKGLADIAASIDLLRGNPACNGTVTTLGFCLGGRLAVLAAAEREVAGVVSFYPVKLQERLEVVKGLTTPIQIHVGDKDPHVPADVVSALGEAIRGKSQAELHVYPGCDHAFFNHTRGSLVYQPEAAATARDRALEFLGRSVGR